MGSKKVTINVSAVYAGSHVRGKGNSRSDKLYRQASAMVRRSDADEVRTVDDLIDVKSSSSSAVAASVDRESVETYGRNSVGHGSPQSLSSRPSFV